MRAEAAAVPVIFGSDAPTVEAYERARRDGGVFEIRSGGAPVKAILLDDRKERGLLAAPLRERLAENLAGGSGDPLARRRDMLRFCCASVAATSRVVRAATSPDLASKRPTPGLPLLQRSATGAGRLSPLRRAIWEPRGAGVEAVAEELRKALPAARIAVFDRERVGTREARERVLASSPAARSMCSWQPLCWPSARVPPAS